MNDYLLDIPWDFIVDPASSIDSNVCNLTNVLNDVCKHYIPHKSVLVRPKDKSWITGTIRRLIRKRDRLHRSYRQTLNTFYLEKWKSARRLVKSEIKKQKRLHSEGITNTIRPS